ncbi:TetR/AcrR family transcriptional regulator [Agromyces aerolatus]|uniref:TetR/AcrR family transcriptional regulator n=1 Tax=Agromyces sp. LY-1074 TaxID=3074080 RepID=UPI0028566370|nr:MULTISPECIES: TetR/AcrR family transcriptional regulator [unclassified Agromyces]MDR5701278.1 TetR/AcrR family transcriptional regulator [Agromyces sp. LY-1074]MDR5707536.1 TetR/AcrR family transcriptional regulator [Agromyces sp. LY-1358]
MTPDSPARPSAEPELPRGVALAWGVAANPQRGPKRELSIERIVEVAAGIADAEGLGAVSMSRVAQALGFTTMSLYRYVSAKDDLLTLMQEFGTGVPPEPEPGDEALPWRERLRRHAAGTLARYREHPWLLDIPIDGTPVTPNNLAWMDAALEILSELPLSEDARIAVMLLITGQTRWQGIIERSYVEAANAAGVDPQLIDDARDAMLDSLVTAEEFPALRRAVDSGVFREGEDPLAFGLERVLDGVEVYVAAQAAGGSAPPVAPEPHEDPAVLADKKVREAQKARREAEKRLRDARKLERIALKEARARAARS